MFQVAGGFFLVCLGLLYYRHYSLYDSYDQGIFNQIFWNSSRGDLFQSSLSSALSSSVLQNHLPPAVSYLHLGQHVNFIFLLWLPLYILVPSPYTLITLQVLLITGAGVVLYWLGRVYLEPPLAGAMALSFYVAGTVLGPTLGNFQDLAPIPIIFFSLFLALEKGWWVAFWILVALGLGIREDAGVAMASLGLYLVVSRRHPLRGLVLASLSLAYVLFVTDWLMPHFSNDVTQRFILGRFGQYTQGQAVSPVQAIVDILTHPWILVADLLGNLPQKLRYLAAQWLPLAFVPAVAGPAWSLAGLPLLELLSMRGQMALDPTIRYALLPVPGLFYGTLLWWSRHQRTWPDRRKFWRLCWGVSLTLVLIANPHRTLSFLIPDSIHPWVYIPGPRQVQHARQVWPLLTQVPPGAAVAATTYLIPPLSGRRAAVRFPDFQQVVGDNSQVQEVDYILVDLWFLSRYQSAFRGDRYALDQSISLLGQLLREEKYGVQAQQDGVFLWQRGHVSQPEALAAWQHAVATFS